MHRKAGFTVADAEERSKRNPCQNLSLYRRKLNVTLITRSKHGEICCDTQKSQIFLRKKTAEETVQGEHEALSRLSKAEFHTGVLLVEQENRMLSAGNFELLLQKSTAERAANAIPILDRQLRSRGEQTWLHAELQSR